MIDGNQSAKVVEKLLRRKTISYRDTRLSLRDRTLFCAALEIQSGLVRDLLPDDIAWRQWCAFLGEPDLDVQVLSDTIKYADGILKEYPSVYLDNDNLLSSDRVVRDVSGFKRQVRNRNLYWGFVAPMGSHWARYFESLDVVSCAALNQWINFLSHVTLRDIDLQAPLLEEYVALEESEKGWQYDGCLLSSMSDIMSEWLTDLTFVAIVPSHGPGAVAELDRASGRLAKYSCMTSDLRLDYFLRRLGVPLDTLLPPGGFSDNPLRRESTLICVPKSMTKNRTISKEPCSLQYFQHGVQRRVDEYLQGHPVLSGRIDLHRQDLSKTLACKGSIRGEWDTVDLSSASDSITTRLVKAVFAHTSYFRPLICLRSDSTVLPNGDSVRLQKYAPMGSDLCFPTMCLVFACVCEQAVRNIAGRASRLQDYRVYGDDIVVRREYTPEVVRLLGELHFEVNSRKSFTTRSLHNFREACGGEYLDGIEVTPVRIPRRMHYNDQGSSMSLSSVEAVSSFVELANRLFERGLLEARRSCLNALQRSCPFYGDLPYTSELYDWTDKWGRSTYVLPTYSTAIQTYRWCCTNFRVPSRYSGARGLPGLHLRQYRVVVARNSCTSTLKPYRLNWTSDDVRYFEYWLTLPDRPVKEDFGVEILPEPVSGLYPARPTWRKTWVSAIC